MKILAVLLLLSSTALASKKSEPDYQEAVLQSFKTVQAGQSCTTSTNTDGTVRANTDGYGNTNGTVNTSGTSTTHCRPKTTAFYTITIGDQTLVIEPKLSGKQATGAVLSLGWSRVFAKESCLYGQLPGSKVQIRSEGGAYHVKVGNRESLYSLVSAQ